MSFNARRSATLEHFTHVRCQPGRGLLKCDWNACGWALIHRNKGEKRGQGGADAKAKRVRQAKLSYVACTHSLQSFLVKPCFCLSPDIYFYLCCTSCWFCLHDTRPKPYTCPRQRWEKSENFIAYNGRSSLSEAGKNPLLFSAMEHFTTKIHTHVVRLSGG